MSRSSTGDKVKFAYAKMMQHPAIFKFYVSKLLIAMMMRKSLFDSAQLCE